MSLPDPAAPDTITITEDHFEDIRSAGADVRLTASESGLGATSSGRIEAVRRLLGEHGFAEGDIALQSIDHTPWGWIAIPMGMLVSFVVLVPFGFRAALAVGFGFAVLCAILTAVKLGTVSVVLQVRCADAERVGRLIDVALTAGVGVQSIVWRYDLAPVDWIAWTRRAIERARIGAEGIAEAFGVQLLGIHAFHEEHTTPRTSYPTLAMPEAQKLESRARLGKAAMSVGESLGTASGVERAGVTVTVRYRVTALAVTSAPAAPAF